ncbi:DUF6279 family lipoprotein [Vibrio caribbeanicus]|uniref:Lipoprotein n=1 Tax=Vibrio caribbeanicus ATCC BAA-2122 TaxID=796620 RepID=E3BHF1_9VIBR|nr:DUF6279 family lipoprotein [Vibrio caribbeanicus]EFP97539.1 hypothetical protein VIBC2010_09692 [Vibrio caribbeanicus ATCC BAA-2122]
MKRLITLIILSFFLFGCGTKFVYNHMDWFVLEYIDDYVDLDETQKELIVNQLAVLSEWHRKEELPNYIHHLDVLSELNFEQLNTSMIGAEEAALRNHYRRLMARLAPSLYSLACSLSIQQKEELLDNIRVRHTSYKEKFEGLSDIEIRERYRERIQNNIEKWMGSLTKDQRDGVQQWSRDLKITVPDWVSHQTKIRLEIQSILARCSNEAVSRAQLYRLLVEPRQLYSPELRVKTEYNREVSNQYIVMILSKMNNRQVRNFRESLHSWREKFIELL